jgi:hypothetical protein
LQGEEIVLHWLASKSTAGFGSTHLVDLQGSHLNMVALRPPALTGGMLASSRIGPAHFSQLVEETQGGGMPPR